MAEVIKPTMIEDLLSLQKELPAIQKTGINPHFGNKYVPLEELMSQVLPILNKYNFVLLQKPTTLDGEPALKYQIIHTSGEIIEDVMPLLSKNPDPQGQGSAITYARRYSLMSLLGIVADQDDDGNQGTPRATGQPTVTAPSASPRKPVSENQKTLLNDLIVKKVAQGERAAFALNVIGKAQPENSLEASKLINALMQLKGDGNE
jgi:hypothetical protein